MPVNKMSDTMLDCIDDCTDCHALCVETINYCLGRGGSHSEDDHIRLMLDCAEICQTSANFLLRGSDLHPLTCEACAEVCDRCARDCERLDGDAGMRDCIESGRRMAGAAGWTAVPEPIHMN